MAYIAVDSGLIQNIFTTYYSLSILKLFMALLLLLLCVQMNEAKKQERINEKLTKFQNQNVR